MTQEILFLHEKLIYYTGTGFYMVLFFICFLFLLWKAEKEVTSVLFYPILLLLLLVVFNPLMVWFWGIIGMDQNVYWRTYWLLLITEVIAYAAVHLVCNTKTPLKKYLTAGVLTLAIALCGSFIVTPQNYTLAENSYKLFDETIAVADILKEENLEGARVTVPIDMVAEIRQYDATIPLTYSRELVYTGRQSVGDEEFVTFTNHLYGVLYTETLPYYNDEMYMAIEGTDTAYIVQTKDSTLTPFLDDSDFLRLFAQTEEHNIYRFEP